MRSLVRLEKNKQKHGCINGGWIGEVKDIMVSRLKKCDIDAEIHI